MKRPGGDRPCVARTDRPRSNGDPAEIERKLRLLDEPRMKPLSDFVRRLRGQRPGVWIPWFDPTDAGTDARILRLCEAPGGMAVTQRGGSGFVSADNDDPSAQNSWTFFREASVDRCHETMTWNAVPWYLGTDRKIAHPSTRDLAAARPALLEVLELMPDLRVVVLLGRKAQRLWHDTALSEPSMRRFATIGAPHQSPLAVNGRPERRQQIIAALKEARRVAGYS